MVSWQGCTSKRNATLRGAKNQYVFQLFGGILSQYRRS